MPIGVLTDCGVIFLGGLLGGALQKALTDDLKQKMQILFGFCSMAIGINSIVKVAAMTPVVIAVLFGYLLGHFWKLEEKTTSFFRWLVKKTGLGGKNVDMFSYITVVALFCCSGFGWFGTLMEGIRGDSSVLLSKAVLDFCVAVVFATTLGKAVSMIALPQLGILMAVFLIGKGCGGFVTDSMFANLTACGGILTLSAGMRVANIKSLPLVDMVPALILIFPLSALWSLIM